MFILFNFGLIRTQNPELTINASFGEHVNAGTSEPPLNCEDERGGEEMLFRCKPSVAMSLEGKRHKLIQKRRMKMEFY